MAVERRRGVEVAHADLGAPSRGGVDHTTNGGQPLLAAVAAPSRVVVTGHFIPATAMTTPTVTEITRPLEPIAHDSFADERDPRASSARDNLVALPRAASAPTAAASPRSMVFTSAA